MRQHLQVGKSFPFWNRFCSVRSVRFAFSVYIFVVVSVVYLEIYEEFNKWRVHLLIHKVFIMIECALGIVVVRLCCSCLHSSQSKKCDPSTFIYLFIYGAQWHNSFSINSLSNDSTGPNHSYLVFSSQTNSLFKQRQKFLCIHINHLTHTDIRNLLITKSNLKHKNKLVHIHEYKNIANQHNNKENAES